MKLYKIGYGLVNSVIDKLPFELHLPGGYQYCGPGTNLEKRLARGDPGINPLDKACKVHDIAYSKFSGDQERREADKELASSAWKRVTSWDASAPERAAALAVTAAMKTKVALSSGSGMKKARKQRRRNASKASTKNRKKCCFKKLIAHTKRALKLGKPQSSNQILDTALVAARNFGIHKNVTKPKIIQLPRSGGSLPLVPIFAGLSALGSLVGSASSLVRAIKATNDAKSAIVRGIKNVHIGSGLYLRPYKNGYGLYLKPYTSSKNL